MLRYGGRSSTKPCAWAGGGGTGVEGKCTYSFNGTRVSGDAVVPARR